MRLRSTSGEACTIRWEGVLKDSKGNEDMWYGVEWDDPSRGKHSGMYQDQQIFNVSQPGSGSFVRVSAANDPTKYNRSTSLAEKIKEHNLRLGYLSLDNSFVETVGDVAEIPENIASINVAFSLVSSFAFIWDLLKIAPHLKTLVLGRCHFTSFEPPTAKFGLCELIINETNLNEEQMKVLFSGFDSLKNVDISFSKFSTMSCISTLETLEEVHVDGLHLTTIPNEFSTLPNLTTLSINHNDITKIEYNGGFAKLKNLLVKNNQIELLYDLDAIQQFPALTDLQMQRNPMQAKLGDIQARQLILARYPQIECLNGSPLLSNERQQCELEYLSYYAADDPSHHPRWEELVAKYGAPAVPKAKTDIKKKIEIKIQCGEKEITRSIPLSTKMETLRTMIKRLMKVTYEMKITLKTGSYVTDRMYPEQTLAELNCTDGAAFVVTDASTADPSVEFAENHERVHDFQIRSIGETA